MLTRIEIDGFKTFEAFSSDLQPFSAIVGPNASGKSNLFEVIADISIDLASLIPSVRSVQLFNDQNAKEYSFGI